MVVKFLQHLLFDAINGLPCEKTDKIKGDFFKPVSSPNAIAASYRERRKRPVCEMWSAARPG
jgi:hypothetical protein